MRVTSNNGFIEGYKCVET